MNKIRFKLNNVKKIFLIIWIPIIIVVNLALIGNIGTIQGTRPIAFNDTWLCHLITIVLGVSLFFIVDLPGLEEDRKYEYSRKNY
jgi:hypothetical protein